MTRKRGSYFFAWKQENGNIGSSENRQLLHTVLTIAKRYGFLQNGKHYWSKSAGRSQTTIWNFDKPKKNKNHPTSKPLDLLAYPIGNSSHENAIVIDTFGGSGSTLMTCEKINRICHTMELDEKYASVILRRYVEDTGDAGLTNMFDVTMVQRLANEYGFYELVIFLEENRADYVHFILYGEA